MIKGIFIVYYDLSLPGGVIKKINNQIGTFQNEGFDIKPVWMKNLYVRGYKLLYRLPFTNISPKWEYSSQFDDLDFIYLRRPLFMNGPFLKFLREIKIHNKNVKIIMEIPTYPYDKEIIKNKRNIPIYIKERLARKKIHNYIDRIAILTDEKTIFSIETLKIINGFDYSKILVKDNYEPDCINLAAVAQFDMWHGYERILKSVANYRQKGGTRNVHLHFVGDGPSLNDYRSIVNNFNLHDCVTFYGMRDSSFLYEIYNKCDLGICSLGAYKKDINYSCELKSREFLAAGLPLITGCRLDISDDENIKPYIKEFPNDNSIMDFNEVISFYDMLYMGRTNTELMEMWNNIRYFSKQRLDISKSLTNVIDYIKK